VDVPRRNIDFAKTFLEEEGIPVLSAAVGGRYPRHVHFHTDSGRAFVKHVRRVRPHALVEAQARAAPPISYGSITLFD